MPKNEWRSTEIRAKARRVARADAEERLRRGTEAKGRTDLWMAAAPSPAPSAHVLLIPRPKGPPPTREELARMTPEEYAVFVATWGKGLWKRKKRR